MASKSPPTTSKSKRSATISASVQEDLLKNEEKEKPISRRKAKSPEELFSKEAQSESKTDENPDVVTTVDVVQKKLKRNFSKRQSPAIKKESELQSLDLFEGSTTPQAPLSSKRRLPEVISDYISADHRKNFEKNIPTPTIHPPTKKSSKSVSSSKTKQQQPRSLDRDSLINNVEFHRAGMHAELQKFGRSDEEIEAKYLSDNHFDDISLEPCGEFGLDFTIEEDRAFMAVQIMLSRINYASSDECFDSSAFKARFHTLRLSFTWTEFYEAYGLHPGKNGSYGGERVKRAREALLKGLTKSRRIGYERRYYGVKDGKRQPLTDIIRVTAPILTLIEGFEGLDEKEAKRVREGKDMSERITRLGIEVSPLLSDMIGNYYLLKPNRLHEEIEQYAGKRRVSRAISLFIEWLLTWNRTRIAIRRKKLAVRLRLGRLVTQRKHKVLQTRLNECIETALKLGYLSSWKLDDQERFLFELNSTKCPRARLKAEDFHEDDDGEMDLKSSELTFDNGLDHQDFDADTNPAIGA